jgi:hypothetical protein
MNNFITEEASVIKERVVKGGQVLLKGQLTECVKLSLAAPGNVWRASRELKIPEPVTMKLQTFPFQMVVTSFFLFNICENMVLQNTPIIYMHSVLALVSKHHDMKACKRHGGEPLCFGDRWKQVISNTCMKLSLALTE